MSEAKQQFPVAIRQSYQTLKAFGFSQKLLDGFERYLHDPEATLNESCKDAYCELLASIPWEKRYEVLNDYLYNELYKKRREGVEPQQQETFWPIYALFSHCKSKLERVLKERLPGKINDEEIPSIAGEMMQKAITAAFKSRDLQNNPFKVGGFLYKACFHFGVGAKVFNVNKSSTIKPEQKQAVQYKLWQKKALSAPLSLDAVREDKNGKIRESRISGEDSCNPVA